jgi:hypothetical protein
MGNPVLEALLEQSSDRNASNHSSIDDGVKRAGAATRARIEEVFSRQAKIAARLRVEKPVVRA